MTVSVFFHSFSERTFNYSSKIKSCQGSICSFESFNDYSLHNLGCVFYVHVCLRTLVLCTCLTEIPLIKHKRLLSILTFYLLVWCIFVSIANSKQNSQNQRHVTQHSHFENNSGSLVIIFLLNSVNFQGNANISLALIIWYEFVNQKYQFSVMISISTRNILWHLDIFTLHCLAPSVKYLQQSIIWDSMCLWYTNDLDHNKVHNGFLLYKVCLVV